MHGTWGWRMRPGLWNNKCGVRSLGRRLAALATCARGTDRGGKRREMVSRPTRGERYRFGRRRRRRAGTREIDVVAAAASTTRRARESGGDVRQRSIGNRWELPPPLRPSLSVHPSTYLRTRTDDAVSPPQCCLGALVLRQRQGGQIVLFQGRVRTRHKIVVESPHDLAVPYLRIHTRGTALASVRDGQMKPSDRSGN